MVNEQSFEKVRESVQDAFAVRPIPCGRSVVSLDPDYDLESKQVMDDFGGKTWTELSEEFLVDNISAVSFLSDSALFYFLPSYLICGSGDSSKAALIRDTIIFRLVAVEYVRDESTLTRELKTLSHSQKDALRDCLNYWKVRFPEDRMTEEIDIMLRYIY